MFENDSILFEQPMVGYSLQSLIAELLELEILQLLELNCFFYLVIAVDVFIVAAEVYVLQPDHDRVSLEPHISQSSLKYTRYIHNFNWRLNFLFRH